MIPFSHPPMPCILTQKYLQGVEGITYLKRESTEPPPKKRKRGEWKGCKIFRFAKHNMPGILHFLTNKQYYHKIYN